MLIGRLGKDPVVRNTSGGLKIVEFSLATGDSSKDSATGQWVEVTEWHNIVVFGKLADIAEQYLSRGSQVFVEGKIKTEKYTDKSTNTDKYMTKIVANNIQMLGDKKESQSRQPGSDDNASYDDIPF